MESDEAWREIDLLRSTVPPIPGEERPAPIPAPVFQDTRPVAIGAPVPGILAFPLLPKEIAARETTGLFGDVPVP